MQEYDRSTARATDAGDCRQPGMRNLTAAPTARARTSDLPSFDRPLPRSLLDIEGKVRSNLFAWRGQFSPQLVEALLCAYAPPHGSVLDPFMGSGTVLVEAARRGHPVVGVEVNPAALTLARVYSLCSFAERERQQIVRRVDEMLDPGRSSDLPLFSNVEANRDPLPALALREPDPHLATLLQATVILADIKAEGSTAERFVRCWRSLRQLVLRLPESTTTVRALHADARALPLPDGSIDFALTSPPYINVFNYHHHYRGSTETLGWNPLVVARSEIGANRKFRQNRFLTVVQYCIDIALMLAELRRVGSDSLRAVLVVGRESAVHMTPFYNARLVAALAAAQGFRVLQQQERAFTNRFGQTIFEDILNLEKSDDREIGDAVGTGREIGIRALEEARIRVPSDRSTFLADALRLAAEVDPSQLLEPTTCRHA